MKKHWMRHLDDMREAAITHDIDFLEADGIDLAGVRFLGCSLWTDFELFGADKKAIAMRVAKARMSDFHCIKISRYPEIHWVHSKHLTPELATLRHQALMAT